MNLKITTLAVAAILFCSNSLFSASATWTWVGGTDVWADKSNWSTTDNQSTPGNNDLVIINDGAVSYPILVADVEVNNFIMNGGWFSTNNYSFESNYDITIYDGNFNADASLITASNIYLYGGNISMQGDKFDISNSVVINGGLFTIISAHVSIPNDIFLTSGTLNLNGYNMAVSGAYTYEGGTLANAGTLSINNLIVDFAGTYALDYTLNVLTSATFTSGIVKTTPSTLLIFDNNASASGMSTISHVDGPVRRLVAASGNTTFDFPVGNGHTYAPIQISDFAQGRAQDYFTAQYFYGNPPYNRASKDITLDHVSAAEYWILDRAATTGTPTTDVFVRLSFDETTRSGIVNTASELRVSRWDGTAWRDHGRASGTGNSTAGTLISNARITNFSPFTIASSTSFNPLPVSLINFNAQPVEKLVKVSWTTTSEINNDFFSVQKSIDGKSWSVIGIVKGVKNSDQVTNYSLKDLAPVEGVQFYRLIQTDVKGKSAISTPISVNIAAGSLSNQVSLFPNPTTSIVNVSLYASSANTGIKVFNSMGMLVMELNDLSGSVYTLDLTDFANGIYTIEVQHENGISVSKVLKN